MKFLLHKKGFWVSIAVLTMLLLVGGFFLLQIALDPHDNRIVANVSIGGLDVGSMTKSEARKALNAAAQETLLQQALPVELPEETILLSPEQTQVTLNVRKAVNAAFQIGRTEGTDENTVCDVGLLTYLRVDEAYIRGELQTYAEQYDTDLTQLTYRLEGDLPDLSTAVQENTDSGQTLELTMGIPTAHLDVNEAYGSILAEFNRAIGECEAGSYGVTIDVPVDAMPDYPNLYVIQKEFAIAPTDDSLDLETCQIIPGTYGYQLDIQAAKEAVWNAAYGETLSLPMEYVEPEIYRDGVYFRDVLGSCETKHNTNENRNTNLRLLCAALDGVILQPGEEFSYNETVGERTAERGYKPAPAYSGTRLTDAIGGGVCQGSTTLYNCVLLADLEVITRLCHGATVSYVPLGLDATVNWGTTDFQFRNSSDFPIKLQAEVSDGYVRMQILGTDDKDYYVKMETRSGDDDVAIYATSYKCKYDKETDELISREVEARSTYYKNIG